MYGTRDHFNACRTLQHVYFSSSLQETTSLQVSCSFSGYQYAGTSSISFAALCTLFTPEDARLIWRTLYNLQPLDSHVDLRSSATSAYIYFRGSRPSSVFVLRRWSVRVERTAHPHPRRSKVFWQFQKAFKNSLFSLWPLYVIGAL